MREVNHAPLGDWMVRRRGKGDPRQMQSHYSYFLNDVIAIDGENIVPPYISNLSQSFHGASLDLSNSLQS